MYFCKKKMAGFLFDEIVFGPVKSRRFGISLGINLLPFTHKFCTFNCIYCECGWTQVDLDRPINWYSREEIKNSLDQHLIEMKERGTAPDNITFAGNGEPTLHPDFEGIVQDCLFLRDKHFPKAKITVLSNSTTLDNDKVFRALYMIDNNVLKLDAGTEETYQLINRPLIKKSLEQTIEKLVCFNGNLIVQSLFLRGTVDGVYIDNTTDKELEAWMNYLKKINPRLVMLYSIDRPTPSGNLEKISHEELNAIAEKVNTLGINTEVY